MRTKTSREISKCLTRDINTLGKPKVFVIYNGVGFKNLLIQKLCRDVGIVQAFCMPYHPQGNAVMERAQRSLKSCLAQVNENHPNRWPEVLQD